MSHRLLLDTTDRLPLTLCFHPRHLNSNSTSRVLCLLLIDLQRGTYYMIFINLVPEMGIDTPLVFSDLAKTLLFLHMGKGNSG